MSNQVMESAVDESSVTRLHSVQDVACFLRTFAIPEDSKGCPESMREYSHRSGELCSPLNGQQPIFALLGYDDIRTLEGRLLTIIDAAFSDQQQRKAVKDLIRNAIWFDWVRHLDTDNPLGGKPDLKY